MLPCFTLVVIRLWARFALRLHEVGRSPRFSPQLSRGDNMQQGYYRLAVLWPRSAPNVVLNIFSVVLLIYHSAWSPFLRAGLSGDPPAQSASRNSGKSSEAGDGMARSWHPRRLERALSLAFLVALVLSSRPASPVIEGKKHTSRRSVAGHFQPKSAGQSSPIVGLLLLQFAVTPGGRRRHWLSERHLLPQHVQHSLRLRALESGRTASNDNLLPRRLPRGRAAIQSFGFCNCSSTLAHPP